MKKNKNQRTRNWSIIVYPESAPENWIDILQKEYVKMVVSPLHDKDVNPDDTLKKAHYHVLFMFDGVKSYNQVKSIADSVNAPIPQIVGSAKGLTRYMLHIDNTDKAQYVYIIKEAHYHVLFNFDGVKYYNQVKSIADSVNATIPQIVGSAKGLTRYMLHLDNPDKAQYDSSDLQAFNGADITELLKPISAD